MKASARSSLKGKIGPKKTSSRRPTRVSKARVSKARVTKARGSKVRAATVKRSVPAKGKLINQYTPPRFRQQSADMVYSGETGTWHIKIECQNVPEENMKTLAPVGPYAYTVHRIRAPEDKRGRLEIITTREAILAYYKELHANVDILDWHQISEVRAGWYGFQYGIGDSRFHVSGETIPPTETILLLPTFGQPGITGELYWYRQTDPANPQNPECGPEARMKTSERFNDLLEAFRKEDIDKIVKAFTEGCQTAICDYVTESGTLASLDGREELRRYYQSLFKKFRVRDVRLVQRMVEDWFVFAELQWTFEARTGARKGQIATCNTAEYAALATDGRMLCRIGHGTAPAYEKNGLS